MSENIPKEEVEREVFLLDDNECEPCAELKEALKDEIAAGRVQVLQVTSDAAIKLLAEVGAPETVQFPSALVRDKSGVRLCEIYHSKDITLSKCGDEIIAIREPKEDDVASTRPGQQPQEPTGQE